MLADSDGKIAQAAVAYGQLAHDFPKKWEVAAAWGRFAWRERHNQEAVTHFARAVELGADDPRVFVDYARALTITLHSDEAVTALCAKPSRSIRRFAKRIMSWVCCWCGVHPGRKASRELKLARPLKPQWAAHYFYNAAYAEFRLGDLVAARNFVEQGRAYTKIPEEVAALNQLSKALGPPVVDGVLSQIDCRGRAADLHVRVGRSAPHIPYSRLTAAKDLACGAQKDVPVRIEFQAMPLGNEGADGIVKSLLVR